MRPPVIGRRMLCLRFSSGPRARRGVTLIELMVALAITMIMMTAVITLFANVTTTVSNSRALVEISERLRTARNRLQLDLAGHTASTIPPLRPEDGEGYFEIIEGPNSDAAAYIPPTPATLNQLGGVPNPISGTAILYAGSFTTGSANDLIGDADDVLMLTVRSQAEPFVGWANGGVLAESNTAEVIWYAVPNGRSLPGDSTSFNGAPVQLYTLYRRVLLVSPTVVPSGVAFTANNPGSISQFYNQYDLSVRSTNNTGAGIAIGNSLTDLTARENRFLHAFQVATPTPPPTPSLTTINTLASSPTTLVPAGWPGISTPTGWPGNAAQAWFASSPPTLNTTNFPFALQNPSYMVSANSTTFLTSSLITIPAALFNNTSTNQRQGEDVVLTDVLSFDIRVFDPLAPIVSGAGNTALIPGDPGYSALPFPPAPGATVQSSAFPFPTGTTLLGYGAFVDMGYGGPLISSSQTPTTPASQPAQLSYFSSLPGIVANASVYAMPGYNATPQVLSQLAVVVAQSLPCTYDTWSWSYEQNGVDEDQVYGIDDGANGLDDDSSGIVDDPPQMGLAAGFVGFTSRQDAMGNSLNPTGERETLAPYPVPLRGVQITIRVYEPDTRQVREMTVVQDFLPD